MQGTFYYNITHTHGETNIHAINVCYSLDTILICYYSHTGKYYEHILSVNYSQDYFYTTLCKHWQKREERMHRLTILCQELF